jgi:uncharacterized protein YndB with AHSA1/START domain
MKVERLSDHEISDASVQAATGHTLEQWFKLIDKQGGAALGRRAIGEWLYEMKVAIWWAATITIEYEIARGQLEKDGKPRGYTICATKSIKAEAARVYAGFADNAALDAWFGKGNQIECKDGGSWVNADGNKALVKKVNPGKTIRLSWEDAGLTMPTPVEVKFQGTPGKCTVMVTIDRLQTRAEADGYRKAWGLALDQLKVSIEA